MEEIQPQQEELSKKERRALRREERDEEFLRTKRTKRLKIALYAVMTLVVLVVIGYGLKEFIAYSERNKPGQFVPSQGREHITPETSHDAYSSLPPTSGWHHSSPASWGVHGKEIPDEVQIHNLEHGGIMIQYKPGIDQKVIDELVRITKRYKSKVILAPYSKLDQDIALTAWERLDKFPVSEFSEGRVMNFIRAFKNKGPEYIPD